MSRENVELVRRCFDLFGRGEMEAVLQYVDPAIETIDAGSDVVAITRHHGTGRASGVTVAALVAYIFTVRDGKLARMRIFNTRSEAVQAAGLPE
jgi:ketosteroid isomerase-like protein